MPKEWTAEETAILLQFYSTSTNAEIKEKLPERSDLAIYKKARKMKLQRNPAIEFKNRSDAKKGEKGSNWRGGVSYSRQGYRMVLMPEHYRASRHGYVMEHIAVWEAANNTKVPDNCCVHHINGVKNDNRIENLQMMTKKDHTILHHTGAKRSKETKQKLSEKAKKRLADPCNHPMYKNIDVLQMQKEVQAGATVKSVCAKYHIDKTTYYKKLKERIYQNA